MKSVRHFDINKSGTNFNTSKISNAIFRHLPPEKCIISSKREDPRRCSALVTMFVRRPDVKNPTVATVQCYGRQCRSFKTGTSIFCSTHDPMDKKNVILYEPNKVSTEWTEGESDMTVEKLQEMYQDYRQSVLDDGKEAILDAEEQFYGLLQLSHRMWNELAVAQDITEGLRNDISYINDEKKGLQLQIEQLQTELQDGQSQRNVLSANISQIQNDVVEKNTELTSKETQNISSLADIKRQSEEIKTLTTTISDLNTALADLTKDRDGLSTQLLDTKANLNSKIEDLRQLALVQSIQSTEYKKAEALIERLKGDVQNLITERDNLDNALRMARNDYSEQSKQLSERKAELEDLKKARTKLQNNIENLSVEVATLKNNLSQRQKDLDTSIAKGKELNTQLETSNARVVEVAKLLDTRMVELETSKLTNQDISVKLQKANADYAVLKLENTNLIETNQQLQELNIIQMSYQNFKSQPNNTQSAFQRYGIPALKADFKSDTKVQKWLDELIPRDKFSENAKQRESRIFIGRAFSSGKKIVLLSLPTGYGKTIAAILAAKEIIDEDEAKLDKVLVLSHDKTNFAYNFFQISDDPSERKVQFPDETWSHCEQSVKSESCINAYQGTWSKTIVIIDEVDTWDKKILKLIQSKKPGFVVIMSATPFTQEGKDNKDVSRYCQDLGFCPTPADMCSISYTTLDEKEIPKLNLVTTSAGLPNTNNNVNDIATYVYNQWSAYTQTTRRIVIAVNNDEDMQNIETEIEAQWAGSAEMDEKEMGKRLAYIYLNGNDPAVRAQWNDTKTDFFRQKYPKITDIESFGQEMYINKSGENKWLRSKKTDVVKSNFRLNPTVVLVIVIKRESGIAGFNLNNADELIIADSFPGNSVTKMRDFIQAVGRVRRYNSHLSRSNPVVNLLMSSKIMATPYGLNQAKIDTGLLYMLPGMVALKGSCRFVQKPVVVVEDSNIDVKQQQQQPTSASTATGGTPTATTRTTAQKATTAATQQPTATTTKPKGRSLFSNQ